MKGELADLAACNDAMHELLMYTVQQEAITADRDLAVGKVQAQYEPALDKCRGLIADIRVQLQAYYMGHLAECEADGKRRVQLGYGVMGRRLCPESVRLATKSWTWGAVLDAVREAFGRKFIRQRDPEIDKDEIKASFPRERLREFGLKIEQDETFYAEPERLPDVEAA